MQQKKAKAGGLQGNSKGKLRLRRCVCLTVASGTVSTGLAEGSSATLQKKMGEAEDSFFLAPFVANLVVHG